MSTPVSEFIKVYLRQNVKHSKSTLFHFKNSTLYIGKMELATMRNKAVLINEFTDMPEVNKLRDNLINACKEFKYTPVLVPLDYGNEIIPNNEEVKQILENRLKYWTSHQQELINNQIRGQYKTYYEQYKKFLYNYNKSKPNAQIQALHKQLSDKEFLKALKLQVAKRRANLK